MDPQQELFIALKKAIEAKGYDVYDSGLPPDNTPYPFVYIGNSIMTDDHGNKTQLLCTVIQTIHVWHNNPRQRGMMSSILSEIKKVCRSLEHTKTFAWMVDGINQDIIPDTTTNTPLMHGVLEIDFKMKGAIENA